MTRSASTSGATPTGRTDGSGTTSPTCCSTSRAACCCSASSGARSTATIGRRERRRGTSGRIRGPPVARPPDSDRGGGLRHSAHGASRLALLRGDVVRSDSGLGLEEALGAVVRRVGGRLRVRDGEQRGHDHRADRRSALRPSVPRRVVGRRCGRTAQRRRLYVALVRDGSHRAADRSSPVRAARASASASACRGMSISTRRPGRSRGICDSLAWPNALTFDYGERPVSFARASGACCCWERFHRHRRRVRATPLLDVARIPRRVVLLILAPSSMSCGSDRIAAERRVSLASAAVFVLVAIAAERLARRFAKDEILQRAAFGLVAAALVVASAVRRLTFRSQETLYRDVIAKAPYNPGGYVGVGLVYLEQGPASSTPRPTCSSRRWPSIPARRWRGGVSR